MIIETEVMKAPNEEIQKVINNKSKQTVLKTWVLRFFIITALFYVVTINAQNYNTFPNSNQVPKAPTLKDLRQQQQIQIQQQNRQQMENLDVNHRPRSNK